MKEFIKSLDPRMLFGFLALLALIMLAIIIGLGNVEKDKSYGLEFILGALTSMASAFAQWAFSSTNSSKKE